ncbi:hypothetical protein G6F70_009120 [Rhizopus microsporus]|nr:hypothetical protein G6F71_009082 [Rhizopus microsporus]KAG1193088.1 hypothetical protein G6F70_009120 [Rhizopus microsporus]KAG1206072.1 hypothetical protein G6F69_009094 [Rhizopus microsporus]KAG1226142.1 hypothetical protein G6F67_009097 [Rhizopus microsporus]KAG1257599.1 hypothetical protein G6F68_009228 [Rhizopus microsporus]
MTGNNLFQLAQIVTELPLHQQGPISTKNDHSRPLVMRKYYGINCQCIEMQPRRGKNLPQNGLDSRAKKLNKLDRNDYEFTIKWLNENIHQIYRDKENKVIGLNEMTEVSLCKAHSSTLYRAKKKHQRSNQAPPSPADSSGTSEDHPRLFGLAAKVRDLPYLAQPSPPECPTASTSMKRKRGIEPSSSTSTPVLNNITYISDPRQPPSCSYSSQLLPPLRNTALNSLTYNLQHQLSFIHHQHHHQQQQQQQQQQIETVSLKSITNDSIYYIRNLAITDTYTFRDLLSEIDLSTPPPPGKRIVITDAEKKKFFPLSQPIRSVIPNPDKPHVEFYLGLSDKASIDWSVL